MHTKIKLYSHMLYMFSQLDIKFYFEESDKIYSHWLSLTAHMTLCSTHQGECISKRIFVRLMIFSVGKGAPCIVTLIPKKLHEVNDSQKCSVVKLPTASLLGNTSFNFGVEEESQKLTFTIWVE